MSEISGITSATRKLRELLRARSVGIQRMNSARSEVLARYQPLFRPEALANLSASDFQGFLLEKNNRHWRGLHRKGPSICKDMPRLRKALGILLDESKLIERRLDLLEKGQPDAVRDLGRAVLTAILMVSNPDKYGVWNSVSNGALKTLGIRPSIPGSLSLGQRYKTLNDVFVKLATEIPTDLWTLDALFTKVRPQTEDADAEPTEGASQKVDPRDVEETLKRLLPDESTRKTVLGMLVESIRAAHSANPASWALTHRANKSGVTLDVGPIFGWFLGRHGIEIPFDSSLPPDVRTEVGELSASPRSGAFKAVSGSEWVTISPDTLTKIWARIREAHLEVIRRSALAVRWSRFYPYHNEEAVGAIEEIVGQSLPRPERPAVQGGGMSVEALVRHVQSKYPDWSSFDHPQFVEDEVVYKQAAVAKAAELLSERALRELLTTGDYDEIISRLDKIGKLNNLLFRGVPRSGDLGILYSETLDRRNFCGAIVDLLYGPGDSPERLGRYVDYVERAGLPNKWTFPTYFLFLTHPDADIFVKPSAAKKFTALVGARDAFTKEVSGEGYRTFRQLATELRGALEGFGPHDMVDIHSFIWVAAGVTDKEQEREGRQKGPVPGEPGADIARERVSGVGAFTTTTFELLTLLHQRPRRELYLERKADFEEHVEDPFRAVFRAAVSRLPEPITKVMESEKNVFSRFLKNDWGQGGAWDFYWGALYPRGGKRVTDAQLFLVVTHEHLEIGFSLGSYAADQSERLLRNSRRYAVVLATTLGASLASSGLTFGKLGTDRMAPDRSVRFEDWLRDPEVSGSSVRLVISADRVTNMPVGELATTVASTWQALFPLVLLAVKEDPVPEIRAFLGDEPGEDEQADTYTVDQLLEDTGFGQATVEEWVRAIERKGQAILYGPPGTGKTYVAERLARHLISGGTGFTELVQFHPSYAYEDFIQGIRPRVGAGNALAFDVVRGRFLDFCQRAAAVKDPCVMIIDEINRANLSRVFGELMYLLEYRNQNTPLAAGGQFQIPSNVRIIGTMNTADRSIALVDHALRRRFAFLRLAPAYDVLESYLVRVAPGFPADRLVKVLQEVNRAIDNPHYEVGISFFLRADLEEQIGDIWRGEIEPYLEEYFFDHGSKMEDLRWTRIRDRLLR